MLLLWVEIIKDKDRCKITRVLILMVICTPIRIRHVKYFDEKWKDIFELLGPESAKSFGKCTCEKSYYKYRPRQANWQLLLFENFQIAFPGLCKKLKPKLLSGYAYFNEYFCCNSL